MLREPLWPRAPVLEDWVFEKLRCSRASCVTTMSLAPGLATPVVVATTPVDDELDLYDAKPVGVERASAAARRVANFAVSAVMVVTAEFTVASRACSCVRGIFSALTRPVTMASVSRPEASPLKLMELIVIVLGVVYGSKRVRLRPPRAGLVAGARGLRAHISP